MVFMFVAAVANAQANLSELFSIVRTEGSTTSEGSRKRMFEILELYSTGEKTLASEWPVIDGALGDPSPFVRDQACAVLATIMVLSAASPIELPESTKQLVLQRFSEASPNLRENAVRVFALMAGGIPAAVVPRLLQLARADPGFNVRGIAVDALASVRVPTPEITNFWVQSLSREQDTSLRGQVLHAFGFYAQTDPEIIQLIINSLRDKDRFVRQEAIAAVIRIGKPALAALPLLRGIRDADADEGLRLNAEGAIRIISAPPAK